MVLSTIEGLESNTPLSELCNKQSHHHWLNELQVSAHQALESLKKSIEIDPNFAKAHYSLSNAYKEAGMNEEAEKELSVYMQMNAAKSE